MSILINHQEDKISSTSNIVGSSNTGGFIVPKGNDNVDRPIASSQTNGLIRYNTTTNVMEAIINGVYVNIGTGGGGTPSSASNYVSNVGGTDNDITLTPSIPITSYTTGLMLTFKYGHDYNSSQVTINVSGLGEVILKKVDPSSFTVAAVNAGSLFRNQIITIVYETDHFQVIDNIDIIPFMMETDIRLSTIVTTKAPAGGVIQGLTIDSNGSTFEVSEGFAAEDTALSFNFGSEIIYLPYVRSGCIIQSSGSWAAGNSANKLDTGSKANSTCYHVFVISQYSSLIGTLTQDVLVSLSPTAPTLPATYSRYRRIGSLFTDGSGNIRQFIQNGDEFIWMSPSLDVNVTNLGTTATSYTLASVPLGVETKALLNMVYSSPTADTPIYISSPYVTDLAPSTTASPLATAITDETNKKNGQQIQCRTNTSAQIRARSGAANTSLALSVVGYIDTRGKK